MKKFILGTVIAVVLAGSAGVIAQSRNEWIGHMFFRQASPELRFDGTLKFQTKAAGTDLFTINQSGPILGASGTALTQMRFYRQTFNPTQIADVSDGTNTSVNQTFTVTGLALTDTVFVNGPAPTALCPPAVWRVSLADTLQGTFSILSGGAVCTPATGIYQVFAIRT
jgi:hypothetical protein